jgi:hypothetical protein
VGGLEAVAVVIGGASRRVGIADLDHVLIDVIAMGVMEVAVVQVVDVGRVYHAASPWVTLGTNRRSHSRYLLHAALTNLKLPPPGRRPQCTPW